MIKYNPKDWFGLIFQFHKSDTLRQMIWVLLCFAVYTACLVWAEKQFPEFNYFSKTITIHSLLGFVIGLLLVFRTNTAYDKWWEGRIHWGAMVNYSRSFALKIKAYVNDEEDNKKIAITTSNFVYALKEHLREGVIYDELESGGLEDIRELRKAKHVPNMIALKLHEKVQEYHKDGKINGEQLINLNKDLTEFLNILGACERIRFTPIPYSYIMFLKKFIFTYTLTLPLGLSYDFSYWTVPIATFVLYIFGSLELLAEEIEEPFGLDNNDISTDELSEKIKGNVHEILA